MKRAAPLLLIALLTLLFASGCASDEPRVAGAVVTPSRAAQSNSGTVAGKTATKPPLARPSPTRTSAQPAPTKTTVGRSANKISVDSGLPADIVAAVEQWAKGGTLGSVPPGQTVDLAISLKQSEGATLLARRVYVAAGPFPMLRQNLTSADLESLWAGSPPADDLQRIVATQSTINALTQILGKPGATVKAVPDADLVNQVWKQSNAIALLPFDALTPRLTVLAIDGISPIDREAAMDNYPGAIDVWVAGDAAAAQEMVAALRAKFPATNRDVERLTTVIMTGVTAMARGTAYIIEKRGDPAYPARKIADVLKAADITIISNEIPFAKDCQPSLDPDLLILCSKPSYIQALQLAGTDLIGLTGNHMLDYGADEFLSTLDLYDEAGMKYYAGGHNADEAAKPLIVTDHGNRLAFLGANSFGPPSDWATDTQPGAQMYDLKAIQKEIAEARKGADVVFVEYQAEETYDYTPSYLNTEQFRATLKAGADIVTGVQSHVPQAVEFGANGKGMILYGLGNLFFDQMYNLQVRQGLIIRHTIYQGHPLQTELLTTMLEEYSQPRWMTPAERETLLKSVYEASGF